jgi:chromosome segregation ATPase
LAASALPSPQPAKLSKTIGDNVAPKASSPHPKTTVSENASLRQIQNTMSELATDKSTSVLTPAKSVSEHSLQSTTMATTQANATDSTAAIDLFSQILAQLIEEATDLASLKNQKTAAKKDFDRRDSEFNKLRPNHEKFPTMEESQKRNKDLAKKALNSIEERYAEKHAKLQKVTRQGAARLLLSGLGSADQDKQKLQSEVDTLKKTTQNLEDRLRQHQSFIEKQQTERHALETENRKVQNELAALRNSQNDFNGEIKPRVDEAHRNAAKFLKDLECMDQRNSEIESHLAALSAKLPNNFEVTFREFLAKVDHLYKEYQPNQNKDKEERMSSDTSNNLVDHSQRILKIENLIKNELMPLNTHVASVIKDQRLAQEHLGITQSNMDSLLGRVTTLESQDFAALFGKLQNEAYESNRILKGLSTSVSNLTSNVDLADLRKKLAYAESATSKVEKLLNEIDDLKKRTEVIEKQPRPRLDNHPPALVEPPNGRAQLVDFEKRLASVEKHARSNTPVPGGSPSATEQLKLTVDALESLEKKIAKIEKQAQQSGRPENARSSTAAPERDFENLKKDIIDVVEHMQSGSDDAMGEVIDGLSTALNKIKRDVENLADTYAPITALAPVTTKVDVISDKVELLAQNERAHSDVLKQIDVKYGNWAIGQTNQLGSVSRDLQERITELYSVDKDLQERVDAVTLGIVNIQKRLDLINTKDMALFILNQMDSTYPNLRATEMTLEQHKSSLQQVEVRFQEIDNNIQTLLAKVPTGNALATQALRQEVDGLTSQITSAKQLATDAKDTVDELAKQVKDGVCESLAVIQCDLGELKTWKESRVEKSPPNVAAAHRAAMSTALDTRATSFSNGNSSNSVRGRSKVESSASRQPSGEPLSKKRRENGLAPPAAKPNGVQRSPRRKRKKLHQDGEDDTDDVDFEPNPPAISDDDDD